MAKPFKFLTLAPGGISNKILLPSVNGHEYHRLMLRARILTILLVGLCLIGIGTAQIMSPETSKAERLAWNLFLVLAPLLLTGLVWMEWSWTAMACVIYGTVGLALDLATLTSILAGKEGTDGMLPLSGLSGLLNLLLIVAGGYALVEALQGPPPPGSRPPSPPSPFSSSAT